MHGDESITRWIDGLRNGDDAAVSKIWEAFFQRLTNIARQRLRAANRSISDEEDIVLSAFKSFFAGIRKGRFPQLNDREDLWRLLFVITSRKVADQFAFQLREKRDARREVTRQEFDSNDSDCYDEMFISNEPSPEFTAECADQLQSLLGRLEHDDLKRIAILKMEGFTNQEIAAQTNRGLTTIERKLRTIREIWSQTFR
jgi:DNA-directed RNA polymerase specialized sigma24 family protein